MKRSRVWVIMFVVLTAFAVGAVRAEALSFNLDFVFAGTTPSGPSPWLSAEFGDAVNGIVRLTLTSHLIADQFVTEWDFNSSSAVTLANVSGANTPDLPAYGSNAFKADGDGLYDIKFMFDQDAASNARFTTGTSVWDINCGSACDFNLLSSAANPAGPAGPFYTAAHIQGLPNGCSGWIANSGTGNGSPGGCGAVPEPSSLLVLGSALAGFSFVGLRFFKR